MDVPTAIDSRVNVDGRLSESPLPTYSRVNVDGRLSESPPTYILSESPLPTYDGVPVSSSLSRYVVGCWWEGAGVGGGWVAGGGRGTGERDGFPLSRERRLGGSPWVPAPYQVRGRLFAGTTDGGSSLRWEGGEGEGQGRGMGSRPVSGTGQAFRGNDGWGVVPTVGGRGGRGTGERDGFPPRIRYGAGFSRERRLGGRPWVPAPYRGTGQAFRRYDGWGVWLNVGYACWGGEGGAAHLAGVHDLKGKRRVVRSVCARVRNRFEVAIAEVGDNELRQRATLGIAAVSNSAVHASQAVDAVVGAY